LNHKHPASALNRLRETINLSSTITDESEINEIFAQGDDYSGKDFTGIDFSSLVLVHILFKGTDFKSAKFENADIADCDFTYANMQFCSFNVFAFDRNIVEGADFDGASIAKSIDWDEQVGQAKNVTVSNITYDQKALSKVLESRPSTSYSIPIRAEQLSEANALAKALKGILEKLNTFSGLRKRAWAEIGQVSTDGVVVRGNVRLKIVAIENGVYKVVRIFRDGVTAHSEMVDMF